ncbi:hypothetical protein [Bacillus toyonensis]|uniref:hypothetical protein n=1 Tax=Bacillus toyonensis TaxID=155322 RepID=UPI000BFCA651|nr:hypothetical protein [Bacillus toyonensis]PHG59732.1 hypothetical protein COI59_26270 [Bacillus toyonensis]
MNSKEKRIRILDLQDQYCQICEYQMKPLKDCVQRHCEIGNELKDLARVLFTESKERRSREVWDDLCRRATNLYEQGFGTIHISKELGCSRSTLCDQLKMRGLWRGKTRLEIQEHSRKKWDDWCCRAKELRENGWSYPKIEKYLKIPASNLRNQMRKRGLESERLI